MGKGENYEICNPLEHLTEAFAGFAKFADFPDFANSSSLQMPQLPHLPQSPHRGICLRQTFFFLRQAYSWSIPTPYQLRTKSVPTPRNGVGWGVLYTEIVSAHASFLWS